MLINWLRNVALKAHKLVISIKVYKMGLHLRNERTSFSDLKALKVRTQFRISHIVNLI